MLKFPVKKIEWAIFTGMEQEGPTKERTDIFTLFVVGNPPVKTILDTYRNSKCNAIYFGAGGRFEYDSKTVMAVAQKTLTRITIESPICDTKLLYVLHTFARAAHWVVPIVWHGKLHKQGMQTVLELSQTLSLFVQTRILVKVDTGSSVLITQLNTNYINSYSQGYVDDKLVVKKER